MSWKVQNGGKIILRWPTAAILEIHKQVYLSQFWTDFHQILCADQHLPQECNLYQNYIFRQIQDGSGSHLRFWIFGHIVVTNEDICLKFGMLIETDLIWVTVAPNPTFTKIQDSGSQHLKPISDDR